jgi:hypothetical protein
MILNLPKDGLDALMDEGKLKIAVFGLGRVGLPLAAAWLRAGQIVIGADVDGEKVDMMKRGVSPMVDEPGIPEAVKAFTKSGRFRATTDLIGASRESDVKLVAVPTTRSERGFVSDYLESALRSIGKGMKNGDAVSIESTVPPTTTEKWARGILEGESSLRAEKEFALAFSPERIYEGRVLEDLEERYPKVVGGVGPRSTDLFATLYSRVAKRGVIRVSSATAAELSKLFEGVYRDVNIALANELAKLCETLNVDFPEIREASNSQPFSHLHRPGVGVGGACIPHYPYFVTEKSEEYGLTMPMVALARSTNESMPQYTVDKAQRALNALGKGFAGIKIAILGLAFRGDVADARNSPTHDLIEILSGRGSSIIVHDPLIERDAELERRGMKIVKRLEEAFDGASLVIVATDHGAYRKIDLERLKKKMDLPAAIVDGANVIPKGKVPRGIYLTGIGIKTINQL